MTAEIRQYAKYRLLDQIWVPSKNYLRRRKKYKLYDPSVAQFTNSDLKHIYDVKTDSFVNDPRQTRAVIVQKVSTRNTFTSHKKLILKVKSKSKAFNLQKSRLNGPLIVAGNEKLMADRRQQISSIQTPILQKKSRQALTPVSGSELGNISLLTPSSTPKPSKPKRIRSQKSLQPSFFEIEKRKRQETEWAAQLVKQLPKNFLSIIGKLTGLQPKLPEHPFTYKHWIESGNNGALVRQIVSQRSGWCMATTLEEANFIWTQWSDSEIFQQLQKLDQYPKAIETDLDTTREAKTTEIRRLIPKRRIEQEYRKHGISLITESPLYEWEPKPVSIESNKIVLYGKLQDNHHLSDKKHLLHSMRDYYTSQGRGHKIFKVLPRSYHVTGPYDAEFKLFEDYFLKKQKQVVDELKREHFEGIPRETFNIWILKPGENSNRGCGIEIFDSLIDIKEQISYKQPQYNKHTYIIQKYITNPLLINGRKFDIRWFSMITSINGKFQGYFYKEGYLRTSSEPYSLDDLDEVDVHLTNDAVQKHNESYGRYEQGNKLSYSEFERYLEKNHPDVNFNRQILTQIQKIVTESIKSVQSRIDPQRVKQSFEIYGYDFMIDEEFNVWLIEANTNPWLETSWPHLARIIPAVIDNALSIVLDPLFPEMHLRKTSGHFKENKFELVYNEISNK